MKAKDFWRIYYSNDTNFPPSLAACEFAEAFASQERVWYANEKLREAAKITESYGEFEATADIRSLIEPKSVNE